MHPSIAMRGLEGTSNPVSKIVEEIGNVTSESDLFYFFDVVSNKTLPEEIPFQVQIRYTSRDGAKMLRVMSSRMVATADRDVVEKLVNVSVVAAGVATRAAKLAKVGFWNKC